MGSSVRFPESIIVPVPQPERVQLAHRHEPVADRCLEDAEGESLPARGRGQLGPAHEVVAHDVEVLDAGAAAKPARDEAPGVVRVEASGVAQQERCDLPKQL